MDINDLKVVELTPVAMNQNMKDLSILPYLDNPAFAKAHKNMSTEFPDVSVMGYVGILVESSTIGVYGVWEESIIIGIVIIVKDAPLVGPTFFTTIVRADLHYMLDAIQRHALNELSYILKNKE